MIGGVPVGPVGAGVDPIHCWSISVNEGWGGCEDMAGGCWEDCKACNNWCPNESVGSDATVGVTVEETVGAMGACCVADGIA